MLTPPMRVLVVDDNTVNRKVASTMLRRLEWQTEEADCGEAALQRMEEGDFDAVLLDISMPGVSGEDVCRALRAREATQHLHIVAYTAHAMESEKSRIMTAGFNAILIKPVSLEALRKAFTR